MAEEVQKIEAQRGDTANLFFVGRNSDMVVIMRPALRITKHEALNLAAWLVALADDDDEFPDLLKAVQNT